MRSSPSSTSKHRATKCQGTKGSSLVRGHKPHVAPRAKHVLTCGSSHVGKSTSLLVPNLVLGRRSMIVVDPKGQLAAIEAGRRKRLGKVTVLNPFSLLKNPV